MTRFLLPLCLLILGACSTTPGTSQSYLKGRNLPEPTPAQFPHCHGYGCVYVTTMTMTEKDWKPFEKLFRKKPKDAEAERTQIAKAIQIFEQMVGKGAGTDVDVAGTFDKGGKYQLDCVDESINTTIYLSLLEQKNLLRFHEVRGPSGRFPFGAWPHQTGTIIEKNSGTLYAVDSWFHDNGQLPEIAPFDIWREGWKPAALPGQPV